MANAKPNRMTVKPTSPPAAPVGTKPEPKDKGYSDKKLANGDVIRTYLFKG